MKKIHPKVDYKRRFSGLYNTYQISRLARVYKEDILRLSFMSLISCWNKCDSSDLAQEGAQGNIQAVLYHLHTQLQRLEAAVPPPLEKDQHQDRAQIARDQLKQEFKISLNAWKGSALDAFLPSIEDGFESLLAAMQQYSYDTMPAERHLVNIVRDITPKIYASMENAPTSKLQLCTQSLASTWKWLVLSSQKATALVTPILSKFIVHSSARRRTESRLEVVKRDLSDTVPDMLALTPGTCVTDTDTELTEGVRVKGNTDITRDTNSIAKIDRLPLQKTVSEEIKVLSR